MLKEKAINLLKQFKGNNYTFGIGVIDQIGTIASQFGKSALLISNTTYLKPVADKVIESLKNKGIVLAGDRVVPDAKPNNPREDVYRLESCILHFKPEVYYCYWWRKFY